MSELKKLFRDPVKVINVGLPSFSDDLKKQGVIVQHVDWRPPAGGNRKIQELLERVRKSQELLDRS